VHDLGATVRWLQDQELIKALPLRYAYGLDTGDIGMSRAVFRAGSTIRGSEHEDAVDGYFDYLAAAIGQFQATMHFMGNQYVELEPGADVGTVETYAVAYHLQGSESDEPDLVTGVRYQDRVGREGEGWLIDHRTVVPQWVRRPSATQVNGAAPGRKGE